MPFTTLFSGPNASDNSRTASKLWDATADAVRFARFIFVFLCLSGSGFDPPPSSAIPAESEGEPEPRRKRLFSRLELKGIPVGLADPSSVFAGKGVLGGLKISVRQRWYEDLGVDGVQQVHLAVFMAIEICASCYNTLITTSQKQDSSSTSVEESMAESTRRSIRSII